MSARLWLVKEAVGIVIGDETPIAAFDSFWDASDYVGEHPDQSLYIEQWNGFVPILTDEDLDRYKNHPSCPGGKDPREGFDEWELPFVMKFLGYAAQLKGMETPQEEPGHFGYEQLLYGYGRVADSII